MADPNPTADGVAGTEADPNAPEFSLQSVYLKDCSFEAPKGPRVEGQWNPNINLELDTATEILSPDLREIVLRISVTAKNGDATAFLVEVQQGGIFAVRNLGEEDYRRAVASIHCAFSFTSTHHCVDFINKNDAAAVILRQLFEHSL